MSFPPRFLLTAIPVLLLSSYASAQTGIGAQAAKQEDFPNQALPKTFPCPQPSILGNVSLHIVIDPRGNVSEAKAVDGPAELFAASEACARTWKYENRPSSPVTRTVILHYESRDCPGAESQGGALQFSWGLRDRFNRVVAYVQGQEPASPAYPEEERKGGIVGSMVLAVPLNADGSVKEIRVMKGLSPRLDKEVMDQLRPLKFKVIDGVSEVQLADARFQITFHATCVVQIITNTE